VRPFFLLAFLRKSIRGQAIRRHGPIIRATPVTKFDYLFGRFAGAYLCFMFAVAIDS
jgi:hypothetical protein